jgi:putative hydrolase of the HAD superfamily
MKQEIDAIILDLGGVLINLDYNKTASELSKLGVDLGYSKAEQHDLFDQLEEGKITGSAFISELSSFTSQDAREEELIRAWNAILLDLPLERLQLVEELRKSFPVYLFSNTNEIHIEEVNKGLKEYHGIHNLDGHFEQVYLSHELGLRKPKVEAFQAIIDEQKLTPERTLFIDDSIQHVIGARNAKLKAEHLELEQEDIHGLLKRLGLI